MQIGKFCLERQNQNSFLACLSLLELAVDSDGLNNPAISLEKLSHAMCINTQGNVH